MTHSIDIAYFECKCGHRCTPPESINAIPQQMEIYEKKGDIRELESKHRGNKFTIRQEGDKQVTRVERSYAQATHDKTELGESNHIVLSCPQCNAVLYEVNWKRR